MEKRGTGEKEEEERESLNEGRGLRLADVTDISIRLWGEESAVKGEVYHWCFVLPKQEETVQAASCMFFPIDSSK